MDAINKVIILLNDEATREWKCIPPPTGALVTVTKTTLETQKHHFSSQIQAVSENLFQAVVSSLID